ncbi:N-glycosylase/DNA lyase [Candidatus Woesearchaeota archaeon]|nr:N-glycosylase/DNA lyase [Candidatus Woesearchaeota archaeon]
MRELLEEYSRKKEIIKSRLDDFKNIKEEEIFYEMCFCLLTPQTSAKAADKCIQELKRVDFRNSYNLNPVKLLKNIRFSNNKSKYLMEAKEKYDLIMKKIKETKDSEELREFLVNNIKGYGYKESSHFLRNIGYRNLAILDRHILKNLKKFNVIEEVPKSLTKKKYFEIEEKFRGFSNKINIQMDELDLLFWSMEAGEVFK